METPATRAANPNRPHAEHVRNTAAGTGGGVLGKLFGVRACPSQAPTELYAGASSCPGRFLSLFPGPWAVNLDCRSFPAAHQVMLHVCDTIVDPGVMKKLKQPSAVSSFDSSACTH